jgi:hypothetical protein
MARILTFDLTRARILTRACLIIDPDWWVPWPRTGLCCGEADGGVLRCQGARARDLGVLGLVVRVVRGSLC